MILSAPAVGQNVPNSLADLNVEFPAEWLVMLREVSPVSTAHSYLFPYWYRAGERWVLYDCWPANLIDPELPVCLGMTGEQFFARVYGKPPRELAPEDRDEYVSDLQHELYRRYKVYACPYWVLQGESGGHQVVFDSFQQRLLAACGLPTEAPQIGTLEACPFDNRAADQLRALNRLNQLAGNIDALRKTGTKEAADALVEYHEAKIRKAELAFLEKQMEPLLDAAQVVSHRSDADEHLAFVPDGHAAKAADALQQYRETGHFSL